MRKALLYFLIPVLIFCISVGIVFIPYRDTVCSNAIDDELRRLASEIQVGLYNQEVTLVKLGAYCRFAAKEVENYDLYTDESSMALSLKEIVQNNDCNTAILCNTEGIGINERGKGVNIASTQYFNRVSEEIGNDTSKYFILQGDGYDNDAIACVYQVAYSGGTKGYLIVIVKSKEFSTNVFSEKLNADYSAYVSDNWVIMAETGNHPKQPGKEDYSLWDVMPAGFKIETLEHALVQNVEFNTHVDDYGYVLAVPAPVSSGAAVVFISDGRMKKTIDDVVKDYDRRVIVFLILSVLILILIMVMASRYHIKKNVKDTVSEKDPLTGLLNKTATLENIKSFMNNDDNRGGILFIMQVDGVSDMAKAKGKEFVEASEISFAKALTERYRSSDIIGRLENDKFAVFVKNVSEEKHIRKQIDDILMFVYDFKQHTSSNEDKAAFMSVGGAIYPSDAENCDELFEAADKALQDARGRGRGLIAMYKK